MDEAENAKKQTDHTTYNRSFQNGTEITGTCMMVSEAPLIQGIKPNRVRPRKIEIALNTPVITIFFVFVFEPYYSKLYFIFTVYDYYQD